jgi:RNA polymerase sigma factor for flagellar operon FliA
MAERASIDAAAADEEARLWQRWRGAADGAAREALVLRHLPFARIVAASLYGQRTHDGLPFDDYLQFAALGLLEALERYDPEQGASFRTFAGHRMRGAVLNGVASGAALRRPAPAAPDVLAQLAEVAVGLALGYLLEEAADAAEPAVPDNAYSGVELRQLQRRVQRAVVLLPEGERRVVQYHYLHQLPFESVMELMGLSRGRVSQLHRSALERLRLALAASARCDQVW